MIFANDYHEPIKIVIRKGKRKDVVVILYNVMLRNVMLRNVILYNVILRIVKLRKGKQKDVCDLVHGEIAQR